MTAVSIDGYAPFDSGAGANVMESVWRQFAPLWIGGAGAFGVNGILRGFGDKFVVYADSSGLQVKVKSGQCWIKGHWGQNNSDKTLAVTTGHATLARIDLVVLRADFVDNVIEVDIKDGTPAASPAAPTLTQDTSVWEISLAQVDVPALDTNIAASQVRDARQYIDWPAPEVRCTGTTTVNNSTTLVDITGMSLALSAGAIYTVEGCIEYSAATAADVKIQLVGQGTSGIASVAPVALDSAATGVTASLNVGAVGLNTNLVCGGAGAGTHVVALVRGWINALSSATSTDPLTNPLTYKFQFAQNTANGSDAVVYPNCWVRFTRASAA